MPSLKNLVLLIATTVASGAHALPTVELVGRQQHLVGWFAMCPGPLWGPGCEVSSWTSKQCYPLPAALNGAVQSASPFKNGVKGTCFLYHEDGCEGERTPSITYPGFDNFETAGIYGLYKSWGCDCGDVCESW